MSEDVELEDSLKEEDTPSETTSSLVTDSQLGTSHNDCNSEHHSLSESMNKGSVSPHAKVAEDLDLFKRNDSKR